jgi:transcriptional regulator with XRE-family HTH domain
MGQISFVVVRDVAKLRPDDVAKLLKINRVTVSQWFNGHTQPHRLLTDRVNKLLDAVALGVEAGELPVPHEISRRERGLYINKVVAPRLQAATSS